MARGLSFLQVARFSEVDGKMGRNMGMES